MPFFRLLVLGFAVRFLSPLPDSLPQLFLRCLPFALASALASAFAFGTFPFRSASFRPLRFRFWLLSLCFFLSSFFPASPHSGFSGAPFRSRFFGFPRSFRPGFPCLLSRFFVLGFLFVSFRPSLLHSHSCSSGAYLVLLLPLSLPPSLSVFYPSGLLPFVRFTSGSGYSAFRAFLSLLPGLPSRRFLRCCFRFPLPSGLFPCLPSDSGTRLPALLFSGRSLASQWLPQRLGLLPFGSRPLPHGFRFRFWLLSSSSYPFGLLLSALHGRVRSERYTYYHMLFYLSTPFLFLTFLFIYPYFIFLPPFSVHLLPKKCYYFHSECSCFFASLNIQLFVQFDNLYCLSSILQQRTKIPNLIFNIHLI